MGLKHGVARVLIGVLGRKQVVRLARFLTMESRLDVPNHYGANGEDLVQRVALEVAAAEGRSVVALDVGANIGDWTEGLLVQAERLGCPVPSVHAFEPTSGTFRLLSSRLGARPGVTLVAKALSDRPGPAVLHVVGSGHIGGSNSLEALHDNADAEAIELTTATRYCEGAGIDRIDLMKIDTEGHDLTVVKGTAPLLEAGRIQLLQFEYNQRWIYARGYLRDAFELFNRWGYRLGKITPRGIEWYDAWHYELESFREANYLACRPEWEPRFPAVSWWGC